MRWLAGPLKTVRSPPRCLLPALIPWLAVLVVLEAPVALVVLAALAALAVLEAPVVLAAPVALVVLEAPAVWSRPSLIPSSTPPM